ncbi:PQQ-dependent sugar dehydrogenase [Kiloniella sp. EL199]|uniref:PQQ-dependent sugar dehydrogenase n=1 Tax=Kiloniella sp. EL199 TaxID=2107581 RepID=UPI000EA21ADC|nr:PQQ-dependent sugar dehydrogenase [Kiloniella sp. EL199]
MLHKKNLTIWLSFLAFFSALNQTAAESPEIFNSEKETFKLELLADGLDHPWGMVFLPDETLLITEREKGLKLYKNKNLRDISLHNFPAVRTRGQGGLLDIAIHPTFEQNQLIYFTYSHPLKEGSTTALAQARFAGQKLLDPQTIFIAETGSTTSRHYGSRIRFNTDGLLFMTIGDRGNRHSAQKLNSHAGKVLRLNDQGQPAANNPFVQDDTALSEIYSYGHRNPQGLAKHYLTGEMWVSEHGPRGGDEINQLQAGSNYGWPIITYGKEYIGGSIGEGTHHPNMQQPVHQWTPSIAPAGITFYSGDAFPNWKGNLFTSALKFKLLVRQELLDGKIVHEERLLEEEVGRIRAVEQGPDDFLYILTDANNGTLYRLKPPNM